MYDYIATLLADAAVLPAESDSELEFELAKIRLISQARLVLDIIEAQSVHTLRSSLPQTQLRRDRRRAGHQQAGVAHPAHQAGAGAAGASDGRPTAQLLESRCQQQTSPRGGAGPTSPAPPARADPGRPQASAARSSGARSGHRRSRIRIGRSAPCTPNPWLPPTRNRAAVDPERFTVMASNSTNNGPKVVNDPHRRFFGAAVAFLAATGVWNLANIWLLDITAQEQWMLGMGVLSAMFATVVVSKVVRDREEARSLVNEVRAGPLRGDPGQRPGPRPGPHVIRRQHVHRRHRTGRTNEMTERIRRARRRSRLQRGRVVLAAPPVPAWVPRPRAGGGRPGAATGAGRRPHRARSRPPSAGLGPRPRRARPRPPSAVGGSRAAHRVGGVGRHHRAAPVRPAFPGGHG